METLIDIEQALLLEVDEAKCPRKVWQLFTFLASSALICPRSSDFWVVQLLCHMCDVSIENRQVERCRRMIEGAVFEQGAR